MVSKDFDSRRHLPETVLEAQLQLDGIDSQSVDLQLTEPIALPFGTFSARPSGWLRLDCKIDEIKHAGYGEGATLPQPLFTADSGNNIAINMSDITWPLQNRGKLTVADALTHTQAYVFADGMYYPTARLACEMALLDAAAKSAELSVSRMIGIPESITEVPFGKSIGGADAITIIDQANDAVSYNARKIKIKISPNIYEEVINAITILRKEHSGIDIMLDANGTFDPTNQTHIYMLQRLDNLGLVMLEEPVSRVGEVRGINAARLLREKIGEFVTPICLDDCLVTDEDCYLSIREGLAQVLNIKPGRIGSFLRSLDLIDMAAESDTQVMIGGMLEATPGRCMTTVLGAYCLKLNFGIPGDLSLAQERLTQDLVPPEKQMSMSGNGTIILPKGNGWGF